MYHTPADLAALLHAALGARERPSPGSDVLGQLLETMYAASLKTEEGQGITFHIAFADPADPDPDPPHRLRSDRWRAVGLEQRIPFSVEQLTKLAKASDPRTSSLATHSDDTGPFVWGLIDQGNQYFDYLNYDAESAQAFRPGIFQASIEGPAHLTVWLDYEKIGELRGTELAGEALDALDRGPVRDTLDVGLRPLVDATFQGHRANLTGTADADANYENPQAEDGGTAETPAEADDIGVAGDGDVVPVARYLANNCVDALKRVLIRAQNFGHGGAVLITPESDASDLNVKYKLPYSRLRDALVNCGIHRLDRWVYSDAIRDLLDEDEDEVPMFLYLDETIADDELTDALSEVQGVVWFVSLLTRVDGLVLLTPDLQVVGFGVEITTRDEPARILRATDALGSSVVELEPTHYGTRHRSMMRFCDRHPGSVGLVVSQDGAVRAITRVRNATVMWDNVKIQNFTTGSRRKQELEERKHARDRGNQSDSDASADSPST